MFGKKSKDGDPFTSVYWVVTVLLFLAMLAAAIGVYKSHFLSSGATFGTTSGSLSIIAFVISLMFWSKACGCCCKKK